MEQNPKIASVFDEDYNPKRIISDLGNIFLNKTINPGKTLLILDEIQMAPKAITALKYFYEDIPELYIIGVGSLLGVSIRNDETSFPIGKIDRMQLYPMNFREFLWATGQENLDKGLDDRDITAELPEYYMEPLKKSLLNYYAIGGMPEAVKTCVETKDFNEVEKIQENLLYGYENDFSKHAPINEIANLEAIWNSIPTQLREDNNKFIFSRVKKSARAKDLEASIQWLVDAGLIHVVEKVEDSKIPLSVNVDNSYYKIYLCDVGLLSKRAGISYAAINNNLEQLGTFKGVLTENYVLMELISLGYNPYYWRSGNIAELDFLIEDKGNVIPIEAKANLNTKAKSFLEFAKRFKPNTGFKFSLKNSGINEVETTKTYSLQLFLVNRIKDVLDI